MCSYVKKGLESKYCESFGKEDIKDEGEFNTKALKYPESFSLELSFVGSLQEIIDKIKRGLYLIADVSIKLCCRLIKIL
jgi:hypothetical protein